MNNENTLLIAPAPTPEEELGVIASADTSTVIVTTEMVGVADSMAENMTGAVQILGQGMASIFVVLGLIAVVVAALKKLDSKKK